MPRLVEWMRVWPHGQYMDLWHPNLLSQWASRSVQSQWWHMDVSAWRSSWQRCDLFPSSLIVHLVVTRALVIVNGVLILAATPPLVLGMKCTNIISREDVLKMNLSRVAGIMLLLRGIVYVLTSHIKSLILLGLNCHGVGAVSSLSWADLGYERSDHLFKPLIHWKLAVGAVLHSGALLSRQTESKKSAR